MSELLTIEEWNEMNKDARKGEYTGPCYCAGCNTQVRKRKYSVTHFPHLGGFEQPYKYCRRCLNAGHDLCFPKRYEEITLPNGNVRYGKQLPMTIERLAEARKMQRWFHK